MEQLIQVQTYIVWCPLSLPRTVLQRLDQFAIVLEAQHLEANQSAQASSASSGRPSPIFKMS
jgi:hypothetical protein